MGAVEILTGLGRVGIPVKGGQAQRLTELLVGVVGPQRRPVVVGAVVEVFPFVLRQGGQDINEPPVGLSLCGNAFQNALLIDLGCPRRDILRVDHRGRRHQHEVHPARVALGKALDGGKVLGHPLFLIFQDAVMPGEHHVLPAQQDAAALGLLEEGGLRRTLQADPLVAAKHLILDVSGVAGEVVVQPVGGNGGQPGPLGQGGVFQFTVRAVGRGHIQHEQPDKEQPEGHQHRIPEQRGSFLCMLFHSGPLLRS